MGILMFKVDKEKIQIALKEMNQTYDGMECDVRNVIEKEDHYDVFVDISSSYPFILNNWERNEFRG